MNVTGNGVIDDIAMVYNCVVHQVLDDPLISSSL